MSIKEYNYLRTGFKDYIAFFFYYKQERENNKCDFSTYRNKTVIFFYFSFLFLVLTHLGSCNIYYSCSWLFSFYQKFIFLNLVTTSLADFLSSLLSCGNFFLNFDKGRRTLRYRYYQGLLSYYTTPIKMILYILLLSNLAINITLHGNSQKYLTFPSNIQPQISNIFKYLQI